VKQGQEVCHRKATAFLLTARLAEVVLQLGLIGHREARAVEQPGAMAAPQAGGLPHRKEVIDDAFKQVPKQGQRQARARVGVGSCRERFAGQTRQGGTSNVAVQDLQEESVNQSDRIENALAKHVSDIAASAFNELRGQGASNIRLELADNFGESKGHPWPPGNEKVLFSPFHSSVRLRFVARSIVSWGCGLS
jgi:hypothetical protein